MLFESSFRYTAYVLTRESKEIYESNDSTAIMATLDEYVEIFGEETSMIGMIDNITGEVHFLRVNEEISGCSVTDMYKSETFKEYFE